METIEFDSWNIRPDRVAQVAKALESGKTVLLPTDSTWAIVCAAHEHKAIQRLRSLRQRIATEQGRAKELESRPLALMCGTLSEVGNYALLNQPQFRLVRRLFPGPYTIILPVSLQVPKTLHTKRKVIGVRMPNHELALAVLERFGKPVFATTARQTNGELLASTADVDASLAAFIDLVVETDPIIPEPSTVLDATDGEAVVLRVGKGEIDPHWTNADESF